MNQPTSKQDPAHDDSFDAEFGKLLSPLPFDTAGKEIATPVIEKLKRPRSKKLTKAEVIYLVLLAILFPVTTVVLYNALPGGDSAGAGANGLGNRIFANKSLLLLLIGLSFLTLLLFISRYRKWKKTVKELSEK